MKMIDNQGRMERDGNVDIRERDIVFALEQEAVHTCVSAHLSVIFFLSSSDLYIYQSGRLNCVPPKKFRLIALFDRKYLAGSFEASKNLNHYFGPYS